jgi:hypothetical protein
MNTYQANVAWTPALQFGGSSTGVTYSTQEGFYTKIGKMVFISGNLIVSSNGGLTGAATLNVPFPAADSDSVIPCIWTSFTTTATTPTGLALQSAVGNFTLYQLNAPSGVGGKVAATGSCFTGGSAGFCFSGHYCATT